MNTKTLLLVGAALAALWYVNSRRNVAAEHAGVASHDQWSPMLAMATGAPFWQTAPFSGR